MSDVYAELMTRSVGVIPPGGKAPREAAAASKKPVGEFIFPKVASTPEPGATPAATAEDVNPKPFWGDIQTASFDEVAHAPEIAPVFVPPTTDLVEDESAEAADSSKAVELFVPDEIAPVLNSTLVPVVAAPRGALSGLVGDYEAGVWLENTLRDLVAAGVSDVHLNMNGISKELSVEARLDGDLEVVRVLEPKFARQVMNMLKTHAELSTSTSLVPDDGQYELPIDGFPYRVRAVLLPTFDGGEKIVLRLPVTGALKPLDGLGISDENLAAIRELLARPSGMTLIAGPMGEGKTTTAHAAIMEIGTHGKVTIAVEDPVERVLVGVSQVEVNEDINAGFGDIMRYLVRSDFDTLFVGEIRDSATAAAAVRMAKAGRRVISTIHATDNVTAMLRLIELSDDSPLSVLDAVSGVISQRLVKKVDHVNGGYSGRHPIHEVMSITNTFTDKLIENKSLGSIREAAGATSTTFAHNLKDLVERGITDNAEARRVIGHDV